MLNFAIIGCGHIAQRHAAEIARIGKLLAVCDIEIDKALALAKTYDTRAYQHSKDLFKNEPAIDVVAVCTPNFLHAPHSVEAFRAGCHVICEKPMAIAAADGELMIKEATRSGKQLFVVKQNRFNPPVAAVKQLLDSDKLGRTYSVHVNCLWNRNDGYYKTPWKGTSLMDGGTLYTQFSHFIDLLYWMFGEVNNVVSYTANFAHKNSVEFEDSGVACLQFDSGALGSIHFSINSYQKNMEGSLTIIAEKGSVKIGGTYLDKIEYQQILNYKIEEPEPGNPPNVYDGYQGTMANHGKVYDHVLEVINNGLPNAFDGHDALKTIQIIEKIYAKANESHS